MRVRARVSMRHLLSILHQEAFGDVAGAAVVVECGLLEVSAVQFGARCGGL